MIGTKGERRTLEVQNYKEVPKNTKKFRSQLFPLDRNTLVDRVSWIPCSLHLQMNLFFL